MFSSSQKSKRKRGVILSPEGWQRLRSAQTRSENTNNNGIPYTLEDLTELTNLSSHTLTKVRRRKNPVDRHTLECYFQAFDLNLANSDYLKPLPKNTANSAAVIPIPQVEPIVASESPDFSDRQSPSLPEGQVPLNSPFYLPRPPVEINSYKTVLQPGSLIRIKAPRRMGKSSLMVRILDYAAQQGCQTVFLSLRLADRNILNNLDKFLQWFSASVGLGMHLPNKLEDYWDELFGSKISCKIYFEQYLLTQSPRPLILALDDVDGLFDYPELADEFFGLLRTWHEQAKNRQIWQQLRLVVAHSTEVYIPLNVNQSPFNVGLPIELESFTARQVAELAQKYQLSSSPAEIEQLMEIASGQPYLVQLALYSLWKDKISLTEILQQAINDRGIFADLLRRQWWYLQQNPILAKAFAEVVAASEPVELELLPAFKLESLGLVKLQGNRAIPSCALYARYFRNRLAI